MKFNYDQSFSKILKEYNEETGKLDLSGLYLKKIPIEIKGLSHLQEVNLSNNEITDFSVLQSLKNLTKLNVSGNKISDVTWLSKLGNLKSLNLSKNHIPNIEELETLSSLTHLNLKRNRLRNVEPLKKLTQLQSLNLDNNIIKNFDSLSDLTLLTLLILSKNKIKDISFLQNLTNLTNLNLESNSLIQIDALEKIVSLDHLNLRSNKISNISCLRNHLNLNLLNLSNNEISDISHLKRCQNLKSLILSRNEISDISILSNLEQLKKINLSRNKIEILEPLKTLEKLDTLHLRGNRITNIHSIIPLLKKGVKAKIKPDIHLGTKGMFLQDNPITTPPIEIIQKGNQAIFNYFQERQKGTIPNKEIKLILVGNSTSGKSSLSKYLRERTFIESQSSTHGGDLMQRWKPKNTDLTVNIWDFGGQEFYHATHRLFLSDNAVYTLLWDKSTNKNGFHPTPIHYKGIGNRKELLEHFPYPYWLASIRYYAQKSPILVTRNKAEKSPTEHYRIKESDKEKYELGSGKFDFEISIKGVYESMQEPEKKETKKWSRAFEEFEERLIEVLESSAARYELIRYWVDIRDEIIEKANTQRFLTYSEYEALCHNHDETPDTELAMIYLRDISGVALHYPNNPILKNKVYIDANWINDRIYTILDYDVRNRFGRFDFQHVMDVLNIGKGEATEMTELMLEFELIFEDNYTIDHYIAPQYLHHEPPEQFESFKHFAKVKPIFFLRFKDFLPRSVIARFIARKGFHSQPNQYWKFGILYKEGLNALVQCDFEENPIITISIEDVTGKEMMAKRIFETLLEIIEFDSNFELSLNKEDFVSYVQVRDHFDAGSYKLKTEAGKWVEIEGFRFLLK
ncbi:MAG: leucine-rich repeat domain-containing protein [Bacteroidetes bacterium]|nr:leucine-rich repeat domain-containing protein [Bacteroidota bacterium]